MSSPKFVLEAGGRFYTDALYGPVVAEDLAWSAESAAEAQERADDLNLWLAEGQRPWRVRPSDVVTFQSEARDPLSVLDQFWDELNPQTNGTWATPSPQALSALKACLAERDRAMHRARQMEIRAIAGNDERAGQHQEAA